MNAEETIFEQALGFDSAAEREAYLRGACGKDRAMLDRLQVLLGAHERAGKFLEHTGRAVDQPVLAAGAPVVTASTAPLTEKAGDRIGRYKLLQKIGEGGCGVVYMAEQDEPVRRRVALKILKLGMDTGQVVARFEAERQALALMDHPNIAKVYDAGATENGRPYFVMELVRGIKITEYCDDKQVPTVQRLELFIQVCQAVQHAHQKGIIHRDLKPSNILVTVNDGSAVPKVIDFGIAKATTGERLTNKTVFTAFEQFMGTPAYMSPEQADISSVDIDTRSDIYSLGVLLYELLTAHTPFDAKELLQAGLDEMRRTIREKEPSRPSTRLSTLAGDALSTTAHRRGLEPLKLVSQLRGDLDWIVMKCLEKDRGRRYETANGLAADIHRYLKSEPVVARPPSNLYRFQKMVRRNKIVSVASVAVVTSLATGLGVSTWMLFRGAAAHRREVAALRETEASNARNLALENRRAAHEKASQAKILFNTGKFEPAERLLDEITPDTMDPDPVHANVRRGLGWWHGLRGEKKQAAANLRILTRVDELDDDFYVTLDYLSYGAALVSLGDKAGYEDFRRAAVARFLSTSSPVIAERICKISLLLPADERLMEQLGKLYRVAASGQGDPHKNQHMINWAYLSLAMVDYRRGNYEKAVESCQQILASPYKTTLRTATAQAILSLAYHSRHRDTEARSALFEARRGMDGIYLGWPTEAAGWTAPKLAADIRDASVGVGPITLLSDAIFGEIMIREAFADIEGYSMPDHGYAAAQYSVGIMYAEGAGVEKDSAEALKWFRRAAEQGLSEACNSLAWLVATSVNPQLRNGKDAVTFAEKAVAATGRTNDSYLDSLAAAYAENGEFQKAVSAETEAIGLNTNADIGKELESHLKLYESGKPCRDDN